MRVSWRVEPLASKRTPQNHGRVLDTAQAKVVDEGVSPSTPLGFLCRHRGEGRVRLIPVVQARQAATAERGRWWRSYRLPTFRLCCINSRDAREAYWDAIDSILLSWFADRSTPKGDHFGIRELRSVRKAIAKRIPRPASPARRASWLKAQHACVARKRTKRDLEHLAAVEAARREALFTVLDLPVGASSVEIRRARDLILRRLQMENARLDQLRQVQAAAEELIAHRASGM